jgi:ribonuclease Z
VFGSFDILKKVGFIFISHSHADHHLGLVSLLRKLKENNIPVYLCGPSCLRQFLSLFSGVDIYTFIETDEAKKLESEFLSLSDFAQKWDAKRFSGKWCLEYFLGYTIKVCGTDHCKDSCAIRIDTDHHSISYSGDSRPSRMFGILSEDVDVMIHESTFDSCFKDKAIITRHSTIDEALRVFKDTGAKRLVLTHFSQRYPKNFTCHEDVTIAFDFFRYVDNQDADKKKRVKEYLMSLKEK